jgi:hypothetical protein
MIPSGRAHILSCSFSCQLSWMPASAGMTDFHPRVELAISIVCEATLTLG